MTKIEPIIIHVTDDNGNVREERLQVRPNTKDIHINFYGDDISNDFEIKNGKLVGKRQINISEREYQQLLALRNADNQADLSLNDFSAVVTEEKQRALKAMGFDYRGKENCPDCQQYMSVEDGISGLEIYIL